MRCSGGVGQLLPRGGGAPAAPKMQETPQDWDEEHRGCAMDLLRGVEWGAALLWAFVAPVREDGPSAGGRGCQGAGGRS